MCDRYPPPLLQSAHLCIIKGGGYSWVESWALNARLEPAQLRREASLLGSAAGAVRQLTVRPLKGGGPWGGPWEALGGPRLRSP